MIYTVQAFKEGKFILHFDFESKNMKLFISVMREVGVHSSDNHIKDIARRFKHFTLSIREQKKDPITRDIRFTVELFGLNSITDNFSEFPVVDLKDVVRSVDIFTTKAEKLKFLEKYGNIVN